MKTLFKFLIVLFLFSCNRTTTRPPSIMPENCGCALPIMNCQSSCGQSNSDCDCQPLNSICSCESARKGDYLNNEIIFTLTDTQVNNIQELIGLINNEPFLQDLTDLKTSMQSLYDFATNFEKKGIRDSVSIAVVRLLKGEDQSNFITYRGEFIYQGSLSKNVNHTAEVKRINVGKVEGGVGSSGAKNIKIVKPDVLADKMAYEQKVILNEWIEAKGGMILFE